MDNNPGGLSPENWGQISSVQDEITRWAQQQFPHRTDHHAIYKLMVEEIPELAMHKKEHGTAGIGPELADCFILLMDLASLWEVDVANAIYEKMRINYTRTWNRDANGIMQHAAPLLPLSPNCPECYKRDMTRILVEPELSSRRAASPTAADDCEAWCDRCQILFDDTVPF